MWQLLLNLLNFYLGWGLDVLIEEGAGVLSGFVDESFQSAGAKIVNRSECLNANVCLCVQMPPKEDIDKMNDNTILVGILNPYEIKTVLVI